MAEYKLYDAANPKDEIAALEGADEYEALAKWAINQGFADPRQFRGTDDDFFVLFDGTVGMVFTNTEIWAVAA